MKLHPSSIARIVLVPALVCGASALAQTTERLSTSSAAVQGNALSSQPVISIDGRIVAYYSDATNLVSGDTNGVRDAFVCDRWTGTTTRASVSSAGVQGNALSSEPVVSSNGHYVAFYSDATNLVTGDTNAVRDVFVRDLIAGTTTRVSVDSAGAQGNALSSGQAISADGRYIAFYSDATNLVPGDTNGVRDVFVHDMQTGATTLVSVGMGGAPGNALSSGPAISGDGRYVAFYSDATNLVPGDTNGVRDVFLRDMVAGTTTRISVDSNGVQGGALSSGPSISGTGRYVAFYSDATNLVPGDTNGVRDVFLRDVIAGTTTRISVDSNGVQGGALSSGPSISDDGHFVAFYSDATNLVAGDTNGVRDVFLRDLALGITTRVSLTAAGAQATGLSSGPTISGNGRFVAFYSDASNLVPGDTNGVEDCFVRDRGALAAQPFCFGDGSQATACPCGNNGAAGKGCANSTPGNQGALVVASGNTVPDTIVLSASAMPSGSTVIFLQGTQRASTGMMYGDGILCASGNYFRLGLKTSVGGAATYPEAADPAISVRSAALGDPVMSSGLCRYYQVYYTDPSTTFCPNPPGNVWNVTNGVALVW